MRGDSIAHPDSRHGADIITSYSSAPLDSGPDHRTNKYTAMTEDEVRISAACLVAKGGAPEGYIFRCASNRNS
jgi:hypothetical protein